MSGQNGFGSIILTILLQKFIPLALALLFIEEVSCPHIVSHNMSLSVTSSLELSLAEQGWINLASAPTWCVWKNSRPLVLFGFEGQRFLENNVDLKSKL